MVSFVTHIRSDAEKEREPKAFLKKVKSIQKDDWGVIGNGPSTSGFQSSRSDFKSIGCSSLSGS